MGNRRWLTIGARSSSIIGWLIIAAVLVRIVSGGGTLDGVWYVLSTKSPFTLALVATTILIAALAMVALVQDRSWAWSASWRGALFALACAAVLLIGGHESAALAAAAAAGVLIVGVAMGLRRDPGS